MDIIKFNLGQKTIIRLQIGLVNVGLYKIEKSDNVLCLRQFYKIP